MSKREMTGEELAAFLKSVGAEAPVDLEPGSKYDVEVGVAPGAALTPELLNHVMAAKTPNLVAFHTMGAYLHEVVRAMAVDLATLAALPTVEAREEAAHGLIHLSLQQVLAITDAAMDAMPCQQGDKEEEEAKCLH